ncbi:hypothetical protein C8A00DRAFT_44942 [Chaetomidium leptoderma]|uniref:FluG domain-containing protein n=1 Tax=Chaetomidium leptoderma TaxID=669021 RepID=A0AAN6VK91_9PEZI|nr:hypothetical protein C8A00DRAFT_44942 [Chaetomidium leptoderma]
MPARCLPQPLADRNAEFIRQFTAKQREADERIAKQPKALTADQRAALRKQLEAIQFLQPDYADATKINIAGLLRKWKSYNLQPPNTLGKDVANADTLLVLLTFNIRYDTGIFPWERHRVQLPGCYLGLAFTGARPAEFVDREKRSDDDECLAELFSYAAIRSTSSDEDKAPDEHSRVLEEMISQEYEGRGRPKALCYEDIQLMVVRHPETGEDVLAMSIRLAHHKGVDNKPKPTIFFFTPTRRLIFCFITIIVSLAVHDRAFAAPKFASVRGVFEARNKGLVKCIPLRWKEEWLKRPVFRQYDESIAEEEPDERKYQPLPYRKLHYDMERHRVGNASDAVRDQMMRHDPKWATFNSAYLNEKVGFHLQNAFLDEPTEDSLLTMLSHIGLMRDPRACKDMVPDEVWEMMPPDSEITALVAERAQLKGGQYRIKGTESEDRIRELTRLIAAKEAKRKKAIRQAYREDYFHNRPTWDIEADAAELMVVLCGTRETVKRNRIRRRAQADVTVKEESPGPDPFPLLMDRKQCPRCIGDETLSLEERTFKYCRPAVMYDHVDKKHAEQLGGVKQMLCNHPKCRGEALDFKHLNHFKNHVERVHGVRLRA